MITATPVQLPTCYPQLCNGAQIAPLRTDYFRIALCGRGGTPEEKIAFVCQYADEAQEKVLLLSECGVPFPRHKPSKPNAIQHLSEFIVKVGTLDVLPAAMFGTAADCYADAWRRYRFLKQFGYQRIFVASDREIDPRAQCAVLFLSPRVKETTRLLAQLYDYDITVLGIAGMNLIEGNC